MAEKYFGASFGFTEIDDAVSSEESKTFKVYGGAKTDFFGYELAYLNFDDFSYSGNGVSGHAVELSGLIFLPLKPGFSIFGKVGVLPYDLSGNTSGSSINTGSGVSNTYGGGIQIDAFKSVSLRAEYQRFEDIEKIEFSLLSVGIAMRF